VFFYLSKILGFFLDPINLLVVAIMLAYLLLRRGRARGAQWLLGVATAFLLILQFTPLSEALLYPLEQRFPRLDPLPAHVDGIVLLGGAQRPVMTRTYGQPSLNAAAESLTSFSALARRYPQARLVFTGGTGDPLNQNLSEAETVRLYLREQGLDPARVLYEEHSRNTYENAALTKPLVQPKAGERWLVIGSAASIPRAMGVFRKVGWNATAYPCDYNANHWSKFHPTLHVRDRVNTITLAIHEWVGLAIYRWTGKMDSFFPAP
jgi:uncharacterized SAM-binding protein YcdF (DUF218 family)